jgi:hypothetical protein
LLSDIGSELKAFAILGFANFSKRAIALCIEGSLLPWI